MVALAVVAVIRALELFGLADRFSLAAMPEADALAEPDALQEAQLVEVRWEAAASAVGLVFDCRGALQIEAANTALLIVRGVSELSWSAVPRGRWTAWNVVSSRPVEEHDRFELDLLCVPDARLRLVAAAAEFYVGDVPGCDAPPPNFVEDDDATIRAGLPSWESKFSPLHASFTERRG